MPDELSRFQITSPSWAERAELGELHSVLSPFASEKRNVFLHSTQLVAAKVALSLNRDKDNPVIVDFGSGTGRFVRFFGRRGASGAGADKLMGVVLAARRVGDAERWCVGGIDGVRIPPPDQSRR